MAQLRVAMISLHTNPVAQPGTGDAGGMNVYILQSALALAKLGVQVELFTRVPKSNANSTAVSQEISLENPNLARDTRKDSGKIRVWEIPVGPPELSKNQLAEVISDFAAAVAQVLSAQFPTPPQVLHSHYWLSGLAGLMLKEQFGIPLVHSMHTIGAVKNLWLAPGDIKESDLRLAAEKNIAQQADALVVATAHEGDDLRRLYAADAEKIFEVAPGVDLEIFHPSVNLSNAPNHANSANFAKFNNSTSGGSSNSEKRLVLFVGRLQRLKAPDVLVRALPFLPADVELVIIGGPSGVGEHIMPTLEKLTVAAGVSERVHFLDPVPPPALARWYRKAALVAVPSYNESFGLVAAEALACGTPVVGACVGGLQEIIHDDECGFLVSGHSPQDWAQSLNRALSPETHSRLAAGARAQSRRFSWANTARDLCEVYRAVVSH
jgi:D-inositol-3-phosphate glycosyltransferase